MKPNDSVEVVELIQSIINLGTCVQNLTKDLNVYHYQNYYALELRNKPVGYIEYKQIVLHGIEYYEIVVIYIIPEHRKSRNVGLFIIGMKHIFTKPIIIGSNSWGGTVFVDGLKLLNSLISSDHFNVKKIDLLTGETSNALEVVKSEIHTSYVFEDDPPPLIHKTSLQDYFIFEWLE